MQEWIKTKDRLPDRVDDYLVAIEIKYKHQNAMEHVVDLATFFFEDGYIDKHWNTVNDWNEGQQHIKVTHWMELPDYPDKQ